MKAIRGWVWTAAMGTAAAALATAARVPQAFCAPADEDKPGDPRVELGRRLFFDPAVSRSGDNACVSCHLPDHGFSSAGRFDVDDFSRTRRHSQTLIDSALSPSFHWDGEFASIEELVFARLTPDASAADAPGASTGTSSDGYGSSTSSAVPKEAAPPAQAAEPPPPLDDEEVKPPVVDPSGYAVPTRRAVAVRERRDAAREDRRHVLGKLRTPNDPESKLDAVTVSNRIEIDGRYAEGFAHAFGSRQVTTARIAEAITAYVKTLRSGTSAYDRFASGDERALSDAAKRGLELFRGRAGCVQCHAMTGARPAFTDHEFHNTGISARARLRHVSTGAGDSLAAEPVTIALPRDLGRGRMTSRPAEDAAFKTPTLRDVALRAPYMHDGSIETLARVVRRYAAGGTADSNLDPRIRRFEASDRDVADLVEFLESLTSDVPVGVAPSPRTRAERTDLRLVDAKGRPIAGLAVTLVADGDRLPGEPPGDAVVRTVSTDAEGRIEFVPGRRTHTRLALPDGLEVPQGGMVPDTCRRLTLTVPVAGRTALAVVFPADAAVPTRLPVDCDHCDIPDEAVALLAEHAPRVLAQARERVTTFVHASTISLGALTLARYEAWVPVLRDPAQGAGRIPAARTRVTIAHPTGPRRVEVKLEAGGETRVDLTK
jgi:cytochrome c peroxidase